MHKSVNSFEKGAGKPSKLYSFKSSGVSREWIRWDCKLHLEVSGQSSGQVNAAESLHCLFTTLSSQHIYDHKMKEQWECWQQLLGGCVLHPGGSTERSGFELT